MKLRPGQNKDLLANQTKVESLILIYLNCQQLLRKFKRSKKKN